MGLSARPGSFHQLTLSFYKATHAVIHQSQRTIEFYTWKRGWHGRTAESECSIELDYVCSQAKGLDSKNKCHSLHYSRPGVCLVGYVSSEFLVSTLKLLNAQNLRSLVDTAHFSASELFPATF